MAFVEKRGKWYRVVFRHAGKRYTHTLKTTKLRCRGRHPGRRPADTHAAQAARAAPPRRSGSAGLRLERRPGPGRAAADTHGTARGRRTRRRSHPRAVANAVYRRTGSRSVEANSLATVRMHLRHFVRTLGADFSMPALTLGKLQEYVGDPGKDKGIHKRRLSPTTMRKELASLRTGVELGRSDGTAHRTISEQRPQVSEDGRQTSIPDVAGNRTADPPRRTEGVGPQGLVGLLVPGP